MATRALEQGAHSSLSDSITELGFARKRNAKRDGPVECREKFEPSSRFEGKKDDYIFTMGDNGLGWVRCFRGVRFETESRV